jgi:hypothetical protein
MNRRAWLAWALGMCLFASGCSSLALPVDSFYSSSPNDWIGQNLNQSDRGGSVDQPTHLTPDRVHGGIGP